MDCFFLSAVRESVCRKALRNSAVEVDDDFWGLFKKAFSSFSSFCADDEHQERQVLSNLKRQRAAAFFMGCCICGLKVRSTDEEGSKMHTQFPSKEGDLQKKNARGDEELGMQWWQESSKKRRKLGRSSNWIAGWGNGNLLSEAPAKLKRSLRRVRAEMKKLGQCQKATSFHYDLSSYSMNFDDSCRQHYGSRDKLFHVPSSSCNSRNCGTFL